MGRAPALILLLAAGCHDSGVVTPDAAPNPDDVPFTGTFVDWDSTAAAPCPIVGATWRTHYDDTRVAVTDTAGAFTLQITSYLPLLDVEPPGDASTCSIPPSRYAIPGIAIAPGAFVSAGGAFVARSFTMARAATFYAGFGSAFDPARANLLVHVDGTQRAIAISSAHEAVQAFDGATWAPGAIGLDVFFPNLDPANLMTTVTVGGTGVGFGSVPIAAGAITYMSVIVN